MRQTVQQRKDYALKRLDMAFERFIRADAKKEQAQALLWISVWQKKHDELLHLRAPDQQLS